MRSGGRDPVRAGQGDSRTEGPALQHDGRRPSHAPREANEGPRQWALRALHHARDPHGLRPGTETTTTTTTMNDWDGRQLQSPTGRSPLLGVREVTTFYATNEPEPATDPAGDPTRFARERIRAAQGMLLRRCRGDEVARQLKYALDAIELWEVHLGRPRPIRGYQM
jgi:hypothetical protein